MHMYIEAVKTRYEAQTAMKDETDLHHAMIWDACNNT